MSAWGDDYLGDPNKKSLLRAAIPLSLSLSLSLDVTLIRCLFWQEREMESGESLSHYATQHRERESSRVSPYELQTPFFAAAAEEQH